ncbi:hypothetical protein SAMN05216382_1197 [Sphingomonas palmae]|uniref:Uncharacterized protein n=1 Tax=Sphingomonas palmae TaxID=1855283 RepID=A0A1H7LCK1_9SPHN|nr:hypothetical protein [Sphingomonas palmae]SEK96077.1 hypothetical protein SAMN05216382_1197 [Sphingomonas palmae]
MISAPLHDTLRQTAITAAVLHVLHAAWPVATDLDPHALGVMGSDDDRLFVAAVRALVDEGLIAIEALLIGTADTPVARGAMLTHKGWSVLDEVTRPM